MGFEAILCVVGKDIRNDQALVGLHTTRGANNVSYSASIITDN